MDVSPMDSDSMPDVPFTVHCVAVAGMVTDISAVA